MCRFLGLFVIGALSMGVTGCSSPDTGVDARALTFMERRAQQIDQNREDMEVLAANVEVVTLRARKLESAFVGVKQGLDRSKVEMDEQLTQMIRLKDELELARARLALTSDAVKELHAWTQGILKNRSELESMQDRTGRTEERLDALSNSVEGLRSTSAAVVETKNAVDDLSERVSQNLERVARLSEATEGVLSNKIDFNFTAHEEAMSQVTEHQRTLLQDHVALKEKYAKLDEAFVTTTEQNKSLAISLDEIRQSMVLLEGSIQSGEAGEGSPELASALQELKKKVESRPEGEPSAAVEDMKSLIKVMDKRLKALESAATDT